MWPNDLPGLGIDIDETVAAGYPWPAGQVTLCLLFYHAHSIRGICIVGLGLPLHKSHETRLINALTQDLKLS